VRFSRARKCYERQGVLVEEEFDRALAREITRLFPGCPPERAERIARHTGERGSGRVGRTAGARAFDPAAVTLAVVAAVRHGDTEYDDLLMAGVDRSDARDRVRAAVDQFSNSGVRRSQNHAGS
jgi:hypothetical protein